MSLRDALREGVSEEELLNIVGLAVGSKKKHHAGERTMSMHLEY